MDEKETNDAPTSNVNPDEKNVSQVDQAVNKNSPIIKTNNEP